VKHWSARSQHGPISKHPRARRGPISKRCDSRRGPIFRRSKIASKCASRRSSSARIDSFKGDLYGKIDTLRWMLGVVVALNAAVFVQVFLRQ
jgi:hypothetical protein